MPSCNLLQVIDVVDCTGSGDVDTSKVGGQCFGVWDFQQQQSSGLALDMRLSGLAHAHLYCTRNASGQLVATPQVVRADEDGCITGLNGNKLCLNPAWTNPSGDWEGVAARESAGGCCVPGHVSCGNSRHLSALRFLATLAGEWRVGAKAAYELFPGGLKSRLQVRWFSRLAWLLPCTLWLL